MELDPWSAAYVAVVLFAAYMVRGITGFGSGLISVPLLAFILPLQFIVPIIVLLDYLGSASQGIRNRAVIAWGEQLPLIPFSLIGLALGLTILKTLSSDMLARALGGFIIAYGIYQLLPMPQPRGSRIFAAPCGLMGGLIGTLFGTGGPFYVIYLGLRRLEKAAFRATLAANFIIDGGIRLVAYAIFGFFSMDALIAILAAAPIVGIALWVGGRIHTGLSVQIFSRLISILLIGSGIALLAKG